MKAEVDKLDIKILVNVLTSLNDLKPKADDLDIGMLKTIPTYLKKVSDVVSKEAAKTRKLLNTNVNSLENKTSDATSLILKNEYHTDKQSL